MNIPRKLSKIQISKFLPGGFTKESAYVLGHLWGDGYVTRPNGGYIVGTDVGVRDARELYPVYQKVGQWNINVLKRTYKGKKYARIYSGEASFGRLAEEMGLRAKAGPHIAIQRMPVNLQPYFWRGLFDADGHVDTYDSQAVCSISSCAEQRWDELERFCKKNGVKFDIKVRSSKSSRCSLFVIPKRENIIRFMQSLHYEEKLGMSRKRESFIEIAEKGIEIANGKYPVGTKIGKLTVVSRRSGLYSFDCDCGRIIEKQNTRRLRLMKIPHCGCDAKSNIIAAQKAAPRKRKTLILRNPAGEKVTIENIDEFCRLHHFTYCKLMVLKEAGQKYRGWEFVEKY